MKTTDIFKTTSKKLNESLAKTFGRKLNLESFTLEQLQDARNKLRTQVSQVRNSSGFNENLESDAFHEAQWMLNAINAELEERAHIDDSVEESDTGDQPIDTMNRAELIDYLNTTEEAVANVSDEELRAAANEQAETIGEGAEFGAYDYEKLALALPSGLTDEKEVLDKGYEQLKAVVGQKAADYRFNYDEDFPSDFVSAYFWLQDHPEADPTHEPDDSTDDSYALASAGHGSDEDYESLQNEVAPPGDKYERMVKHIKKGYAKDGKLTPKEKSIAYATAWKAKNKASESIEGEDMTTLHEGEIQQAQSIVTAKTMVDRLGRWIEDLSGMENDTLLTLGDQIRDEMSSDLAKQFISTVAPALQQAIENLKQTRETLATGVRVLTGEEQGAEMLGGEPGAETAPEDEFAAAEPDAMNAEPEVAPEDEFAAAEPAVGGAEDAGRAKRESVDYSNRLLKVLAG